MASPSTTQNANESPASIFPIREYIDIIWQRKWFFLLAFVITVCLGTAYTLHQPKIYEAVTTVVIDPEPKAVGVIEQTASEQRYLSDTYYDTQLRIMQSRFVAQNVIDDLGLATDLDFLGLSKIKDANILTQKMAEIDPVTVLLDCLKVEAVSGTRLVKIRIRHQNPELAKEIAAKIAESYEAQNIKQRLESLDKTYKFIDEQYKLNEAKLAEARNALNAFKENHAILYSNPVEQQKITNQRLEYLHSKRIDIETQRQHAGYLLNGLKAIPIDIENVRAYDLLTDSNSLQAAVDECRTLEREEKKLLITYLEKSPHVTAIHEQIQMCKDNVIANMKNIITGFDTRYQALVKLNREIDQEIETLQHESLELDQLRLLYEQFESQRQAQERLYEESQKKLNQVSLNRLMEVNNIHILDDAIASKSPVSPNLILNALITLLAAIIAGIILVFLLELLDISVRTQSDIEDRARLPFLGSVPKFPRSRAYSGQGAYRYIIENPRSPVSESIRTLRTTLSFQLKGDKSHVLLVTSAQPLEGKTMTSINLAVTSALSGQRVVLIEADLRRPRIYEALRLSSNKGLSAVITGKQKIEDALMETEVKGLTLLPCGEIPSNPAELFNTKAFEELLIKLREMFDIVIIDSPPATVVTDALIIARYVHGVILIARAEKTPLPLLIRTRELLEGVQAPIMGVVLNDMSSHSRGYYGGYYYHKSYSDD